MLHRRKEAEIIEAEIIEKVDDDVKVPKSVKPLSKKHFEPLTQEIGSMKTMLAESNKNLSDIKELLSKLQKPVEKPEPVELVKPDEEVK